MAASYFTPELFSFLKQLKRNNRRNWFLKNKDRYEEIARQPALRFISDLRFQLRSVSPWLVADPAPHRGSLFRIYRDTRFSSDKRPFKTHVGIHFSHEKGRDAHAPVFYLHLEPDNCFAAAGVWHPDAASLRKIRAAVVANPAEWKAIRKKIELDGDKLSRPPRGFNPNHQFIEDLKFKDFIASAELSEKQICGAKCMRDFVAACRAMTPLVEFTTKALGLKY